MTTYPPYIPRASAGSPSYRTYRYQAGQAHCHDCPSRDCSPFPHNGTAAATVRGKPSTPSYQHLRAGFTDVPYQTRAQTYAWVIEQGHIRRDTRDKKTEEWVFEQQLFLPEVEVKHKDYLPAAWGEKTRNKMWEELVYSCGMEADRWMRQEEEIRRLAAERERAKARYVQEELKRVEARIRHKRGVDRQQMMEEKLQVQVEARERERRERMSAQRAIIEAWNAYEGGWESLARSTGPLGFQDIPWPTKTIARGPCDITPSSIVTLLLSPFHSTKQTRRERLRNAQLRWHPDRFRRLMSRVREEDKEAIEEGVGIVARCLNELM